MEFMDVYTLQLQTQIMYLLKQFRWNKTVANDMLVTLDILQLHTGFVAPIMENVTPPIEYVGHSFFLHLRRQLSEIDGSLWIEHAWTLSLQRLGDRSLMEVFTQIPSIMTGDLRKANLARLYLRVVTIADLADPTGRFFPDGMLTGSWQADWICIGRIFHYHPNCTGQHFEDTSGDPSATLIILYRLIWAA